MPAAATVPRLMKVAKVELRFLEWGRGVGERKMRMKRNGSGGMGAGGGDAGEKEER